MRKKLSSASPGQTASPACERIDRQTLVDIIEATSEGCAERNREKLRRVARTTDLIAVGWFHCGIAECPARQARYAHQGFQERFDRAMAEHFKHPVNKPPLGYVTTPFAVRVTG